MGILLTDAALAHVRGVLAQHPKAVGLRLGVKKTGCSGYGYVVGIADTVDAQDEVFTQHDVKVVVCKKDLGKLDGTEVDFVSEGLNRHFKFHNPKAEHYCGCGESFTLKAPEEGEEHGH